MANAIYPVYKQNLLAGTSGYDLDNNTSTDGPYCALVDTGLYTYNGAHDFWDDVLAPSPTGQASIGTPQRISTPTVALGVFDGDDLTFTAVVGATVEALVVYRHNAGANSTWPLVFYEDTSVTGLPVTPNGGDITVTWNGSGIFLISDGNAKENVRKIGEWGPANIYDYNYRGDDEAIRCQGFIAQEVQQFAPEAVQDFNGVLAVNYLKAMERIGQLSA